MEEDKTGKEESAFSFRASLCLFLDGSELEQTVGEQKNDTWAEPLSQQTVEFPHGEVFGYQNYIF